MSRFDDLLKAKKLKPGEPELSSSVALPKSKDPNFVRTTVYLSKQLHRQLKSAAAQSGQEMSELGALLDGAQQQELAVACQAIMNLQQDLGARAVDLVDALELQDHVARVFAQREVDMAGEVLRGAKEKRSLQLEHDDARCVAQRGKTMGHGDREEVGT